MSSSNWYEWLPEPEIVISMLETYKKCFSLFVVDRLKKTDNIHYQKAKKAIVKLLIERSRNDLIEKYLIDLSDYQ
jgi:hypothetical protein